MTSVLIAEDDGNLRGTLEELLGSAGFEVTGVSNGERALAAFHEKREAGAPFDVVVLDLLLPKVAGLDVAEQIKGGGHALILMSGVFKSAQHVQDAKDKLQPKGFLIKPFQNDDLLQLCLDAAPAGASAGAEVEKQPMPVEGGLLENPPLHLLWRAAREQHTGILDVFGGQKRGRVFVYRGRATMAQASDPQINVAIELIREGVLSAELFQQAMQLVGERRQGLYTVIKAEGWASDSDFKAAYKKVIPKAVGFVVAASGSFRWTDTDAFSKLIPAAPLDLLGALEAGLRGATLAELMPHVEPRQPLSLAPGDNWDQVVGKLESACGSSSLARAINGRATIAQMLSAARNDEDKAARYRQAYLLMSTQAVIASTEVIKMDRAAAAPPEPEPAPQPAPASPQAAANTVDAKVAAASAATAPTEADAEIDFTPEEQQARDKVFAKLQEIKDLGHYEILGLEPGAEDGDIKKAYYALARDFHPDSFSGLRLGSAEPALDAVYALVQDAHNTLSDAKKRAEYDAGLQMEEAGMNTDIGALFEAERHFTKAKTLVDRGEMVAAVKLLEVAHEVNPQNGEWKAYLVYSRWWKDRNPADAGAAIHTIDEISKDMEAMADLPYFAGHIALEAGDLKRAQRYLKRCLGINPNHVMATRAMRTLHKKAEGAQKAGGGGIGRFLKR